MDKYSSSKDELKKEQHFRKDERSRRSRSRSPRRSRDQKEHSRHSHHRRDERKRHSSSSSSSDDDKRHHKKPSNAPPPPMISKISISLKSDKSSTGKLQMKLNPPSSAKSVVPLPKPSVASAFNVDSDDETEEMPAECKMRMRNIGKNTPTSSGPNSFGKTKIGFVDSKKIFEKKLLEMAKTLGD